MTSKQTQSSEPSADPVIPGLSKPKFRSKLTNGKALLANNVDARSLWVRRFRDLIALHTNDLGGADLVSESEKQLIRRCGALCVELERMESEWAAAGASTIPQLESYQRASNTLRRLMQVLGLQRRAREVSPRSQVCPGCTAVRQPDNEVEE